MYVKNEFHIPVCVRQYEIRLPQLFPCSVWWKPFCWAVNLKTFIFQVAFIIIHDFQDSTKSINGLHSYTLCL